MVKDKEIKSLEGKSTEKKRSLVRDQNLSPLVCRKLSFPDKKIRGFKTNAAKKVFSHAKIKNTLYFDVEWEGSLSQYSLTSKVILQNVRKHCPDLLIDYLLTQINT